MILAGLGMVDIFMAMIFRNLSIVALLVLPLAALQNRVYQAALHERFRDFPSAPQHNPSFLYDSQKFTGLGWVVEDSRKQVALISPKHCVFAKHFAPRVGETMRFLNGNGAIVSRSISQVATVMDLDGSESDVVVATLALPVTQVDDLVSFFPMYDLTHNQQYQGLPLVVFGQSGRAGRGVVDRIFVPFDSQSVELGVIDAYTFKYITDANQDPKATDHDCYLEFGDSGSPSFHLLNGQATIMGTHSAISPAGAVRNHFDSFLKPIIGGINTIMAVEGYHMTRANPQVTFLDTLLTSSELRARMPGTLQVEVRNANLADANNLTVLLVFGTGMQPDAIVGDGWICDRITPLSWRCRKGGLVKNTVSSLQLSWSSLPVAGGLAIQCDCKADESLQISQQLQATISPSYQEWAEMNGVGAAEQDADRDGVTNLTEYGMDTNPTVFDHPLRVTRTADSLQVGFSRRRDFAERGLSYDVEFSADLVNWFNSVPAMVTVNQVDRDPVSVNWMDGVVTLALNYERKFVRVKVSLSE